MHKQHIIPFYSAYEIVLSSPNAQTPRYSIKIFRNKMAAQTANEKKLFFKFFTKEKQPYVDNTDKSLLTCDYKAFISAVNVTIQEGAYDISTFIGTKMRTPPVTMCRHLLLQDSW